MLCDEQYSPCVGELSGTFQSAVGFVWLVEYSRGEQVRS